MQRGVGKHDPELAVARRDRGGDRRAGPAGQQHDRPPRRWPAGTAPVSSTSHSSRAAARSATISANGLSSRCLRARSADDGGLAARVHGEVVSAQPLDRHHWPPASSAGRFAPAGRPRHLVSPRVEQAQPRPAGRAADRLGVEPAVRRIVVLRLAFRAHGERRHGGQRPVVGHAGDDGEPGPAVGAVDERVAEPPVRRVRQLGQAVVTGRAVGRDQRAAAAGVVAGDDREPGRPGGGHRRRRHPVHPGQRRRLRLQQRPEIAQRMLPRPRPLRTRHRRRCRPTRPGPAGWRGSRRRGGSPPPARPLPRGRMPGRAGHPASLPFPVPASQRPPRPGRHHNRLCRDHRHEGRSPLP